MVCHVYIIAIAIFNKNAIKIDILGDMNPEMHLLLPIPGLRFLFQPHALYGYLQSNLPGW